MKRKFRLWHERREMLKQKAIFTYKIDAETARNILSVMDDLSDKETQGNAYSCVIIADAGLDKRKNDPTTATMVILPNEVIIQGHPFLRNVHTPPVFSKTIDTQELEWSAADEGIRIAAQKLGKDFHALVVTDCEMARDILSNAPSRPGHITVRHPTVDCDSSSAHKKLHDAVHEICWHVRNEEKPIASDRQFTREQLEAGTYSRHSHPTGSMSK